MNISTGFFTAEFAENAENDLNPLRTLRSLRCNMCLTATNLHKSSRIWYIYA
jgi:hypothetical protein